MKKIYLPALLSFCLFACSQLLLAQGSKDFKKLAWIAGDWKRTNDEQGQTTLESWVKQSETVWKGTGITLKGNDTLLIEKLSIIASNGKVYYIADIPGNPEPVWFRMTVITDNGFSCENGEHDFPKKIDYRKEGKKLSATISGDGKSIDYSFRKKNN